MHLIHKPKIAHLDSNLLIHALLLFLDLLLELLESCSVWRSSIGLEYLDIPNLE